MGLLDRFRTPQRDAGARAHKVNVAGGVKLPAHLTAASALRRRTTLSAQGSIIVPHEQPPKRGMWVRYSGRTGILTGLEAGDIATVMLVDDELGQNVLEAHVPAASLRQAYFEEIPRARRPAYDIAARMGYVSKPT